MMKVILALLLLISSQCFSAGNLPVIFGQCNGITGAKFLTSTACFSNGNTISGVSGNGTQTISASVIDWSKGNVFSKTLGANTTFTFSNLTDGQTIVVALTNTASNWTVTWPGTVKWSGGSAPTQTTGAHTDVYTFIDIGGTVYGSAIQNF